jgi:hypothetical protein
VIGDLPRYNPSDLEEWASDVPEPQASNGTAEAAGFIVNPAAEPPEDLLALMIQDQKMRATWETARTDLKDNSASGHDYSLMTWLLPRGASEQVVVDFCVARARMKGEEIKPARYFEHSLRNAVRDLGTSSPGTKRPAPAVPLVMPAVASAPLPPREPPIQWYSPDELPERDPDDDIARDLLAPGELVCVAGASASGKSFLALDLCVAVAGNRDSFLAQRVQHHGSVLYMAGEGFSGLRARVKAADPEGHATARLRFASHVPTLRDPQSVKATLDAARKVIAEVMHGEVPLLLVIDTFAQATAGENENDNGAMGEAARAAQSFARELGCAVLLVHHAKKSRQAGDSFLRGAGSLLCALDAAWGIERVAGNEYARIITCEKQKDRASDGAWRIEFEPVTVGKSQTLRIAKVEILSSAAKERMTLKKGSALRVLRRDAILEELLSHEKGISPRVLREKLLRRGLSLCDRTLRTQLDGLRAAQLVDYEGAAKARRYRLTSRGSAVVVKTLREIDELASDPALLCPFGEVENPVGDAENTDPEGCRVGDDQKSNADDALDSEHGNDSGSADQQERGSRSRKRQSGKRTRKGTRKRKQRRSAIRKHGTPLGVPVPFPDSPPAPVEDDSPAAVPQDDAAASAGTAPRADLFPGPTILDPESSGSVGGP